MSNEKALFKLMGLVFMSGTKVRDLFAIKSFIPKSIIDFNAKEMYEHCLTVVAEGSGTSTRQRAESSVVFQRCCTVLWLRSRISSVNET
jgi:hypothetical protein